MKKILTLFFLRGLFFPITGCANTRETIFTGYPDRMDTYYKPFMKDIKQFRKDMNSTKIGYGDIWIRDVAPVVTDRLVKFNYSPDYLPKKQSKKIQARFQDWLKENEFDYKQSDIVLDGGNFIYNGKKTVIITKRILKDNPEYSQESLVNKLKELLNVDKVILIDEEPGDVLGHADGQVHFIQSNVLFIGDFEGKETVKKQIKLAAPEIKIVDLPSNYQAEGQYDETIPSAKGLYINMMETENDIYVPKYGLKSDQKIIDTVSKYTKKKIHSVDVSELSTLGGSINCLTWYCPAELLPQKVAGESE